jgi:uncharacterized iron-regulated membrane protein
VALFCAAVGATVCLFAYLLARASGDLKNVPWYIMPLSGAMLGIIGLKVLSAFDRHRARRYHAGKAPGSIGRLIIFLFLGAILLAVVYCVVLSLG